MRWMRPFYAKSKDVFLKNVIKLVSESSRYLSGNGVKSISNTEMADLISAEGD